jgi:(1->4)-alpha-D-glucan 1-alpha-D-glucosylmutase
LPASWPVAGTTGYDLLAYVNGLFVESNGEVELTRALVDFTGDDEDFTTAVWNGKVFVVDNILRSDVERLAAQFRALAQNHRSIRDYTSEQFHGVVRAMLIAFPVYRTYCVAEPQQRTQTDVEYIAEARRLVLQSDLGVEEPLLKFFCDVLAMKIDGEAEGALAMRFQQTSGPVMAKGMEDTAFYRSIRLVSLNEVGCEPEWFGVRPDDFHAVCAEIQRLWPNTLVASTTHDTKRSEDVRYRLHAISEIPDEWSQAVQRWAAMNERHRRPVRHEDPDGASWPSRRDEYLFYQSLVGAFPLSVDRAVQYMMKATKEAKLETSWTEPNAGYDNALEAFVQSTLDNMAFVDDVEQFVERLKAAGEATSLAATVVKLTMPGAPDIYQGAELWTLTLVDPDNRQPVDFDERISALRDGKHPKMVVTHRLLQLRADHPEWFDGRSDYAPLWSTGDKSAHVLAYRRAGIVVVVPRLLMGVRDGWMGTTFGLPPGEWRNVFTEEIVKGGQVELETLFSGFPVAVLVTTTEGEA